MRGEEGLSTLWFNQRDVGLSALRREMKSCGTTVGFFTRMFTSLAAKIDRILETKNAKLKDEYREDNLDGESDTPVDLGLLLPGGKMSG